MFYDIFISLCDKKKITAARVRKDLGISQSTMASWKARGLTPKMETVEKLANYFSVSVEYLLGNTTDSQQAHLHNRKSAQGTMYGSFSYEQMCDLYEGMTRSRLEAAYAKLDLVGHQKVADYAEKLVEDSKYLVDPESPYYKIKDTAPRPDVPEPISDGTDTTTEEKPPETP